MPTWPASLPQQPLIDGYEENTPNTLVRSQIGNGADKTRRRSTVGVRAFTMQLILDQFQTVTLESFIDNDVSGGALRFDWKHPRTEESVRFRFLPLDDDALIKYTGLSANYYQVQMQLEIVPS